MDKTEKCKAEQKHLADLFEGFNDRKDDFKANQPPEHFNLNRTNVELLQDEDYVSYLMMAVGWDAVDELMQGLGWTAVKRYEWWCSHGMKELFAKANPSLATQLDNATRSTTIASAPAPASSATSASAPKNTQHQQSLNLPTASCGAAMRSPPLSPTSATLPLHE